MYYILKDGHCFTRLSGGLNGPIKAAQEHYEDGDEWWTALQDSESTAAGMALLLTMLQAVPFAAVRIKTVYTTRPPYVMAISAS